MASGRVDYSSRVVIKTGPTLRPNEIEIPYTTAMICYEEDIVNRYHRIYGCSIAEALSAFNAALYYYDPNFANIFNDICKEGNGLWTLINRNPTINEKGTPFVKIKKCHNVYNDFTMDLPPDILTGLGAD